jgi:hypothetical protein
MEYRFQAIRKSGYLHVVVTGDNTPETVLRYLREIYEACSKFNCPSVLVEENLQGPGLPLGEIFGVVEEGSRTVWPVVQRVAYVDVNRRHDLKDMKFAETVAVNRSVNIRVFADVASAESWLRPPAKP